MAQYKHGAYVSEVPTSVISPVVAESALPVFVGTAPLHLSATGLEDLDKKVNYPVLAYMYEEPVTQLGFLKSRWNDYTLCQCIYSQFALYASAPAIFINVLDPSRHKKSVAEAAYDIANEQAILGQDVLLDSVVVKASESGDALVAGVDYSLGWNSDGDAVLNVLTGGALDSTTSVWASFDAIDPTLVTEDDIIGGYNVATNKYEGLELINSIFPKYRLVPCNLVVPKWGGLPEVEAVMYAKMDNINGVFKGMVLADIPANSDGALTYSEVAEWKNRNNYVHDKLVAFWPKMRLGDRIYDPSVQAAGLMGVVDAANGGVPVDVFSNYNAQMDSMVLEDGTEVDLDIIQANYLNGEGVTSLINWIGGWRFWGVQTAAYPANTDVKDSMIAVRRMFNWIGNTIILTYFQKVDRPMVKRRIETIIDSLTLWLNGLASREFLIGHPTIQFRQEDNPTTDLLAGIVRFHVRVTPPPSMKEIEFILEYDVTQIEALAATLAAAA